jgi:nucleotide-binding universal stress UspA family protein
MGGSIVCAIDESGESRSAASHAMRLARRLRRRAVLVPIGDSSHPASALIDVAQREAADLIVVPAASRSIVDALMRDAPCPVMVVRSRPLTATA